VSDHARVRIIAAISPVPENGEPVALGALLRSMIAMVRTNVARVRRGRRTPNR